MWVLTYHPDLHSIIVYIYILKPWAFVTCTVCFIQPFHCQDPLIDFTLSNARRFYSSKGDPLVVKGLRMSAKGYHSWLKIDIFIL